MVLTDDENYELFYHMKDSNLIDTSIKTTFDYILDNFKVENDYVFVKYIPD